MATWTCEWHVAEGIFIDYTGADPDSARQFLEMAGGRVNQAVKLYREIDKSETEQHRVAHAMDAICRRMAFDQSEGGEQAANPADGQDRGAQAINHLFRQPSYNDPDSWMQVIQKAKAAGKWVLVNVQLADAFASHALNRDVWGDETVQDLVQENFVFWQRDNLCTEGEQFVRTYTCETQLPAICMIDPRTGRGVKTWAGAKWSQPHIASECLLDILERYPAPVGGGGPAEGDVYCDCFETTAQLSAAAAAKGAKVVDIEDPLYTSFLHGDFERMCQEIGFSKKPYYLRGEEDEE